MPTMCVICGDIQISFFSSIHHFLHCHNGKIQGVRIFGYYGYYPVTKMKVAPLSACSFCEKAFDSEYLFFTHFLISHLPTVHEYYKKTFPYIDNYDSEITFECRQGTIVVHNFFEIKERYPITCYPNNSTMPYHSASVPPSSTDYKETAGSRHLCEKKEYGQNMKMPVASLAIEEAAQFIKRRLHLLNLDPEFEKSIKQMYSTIFKCLDIRIARHVLAIATFEMKPETMFKMERLLEENYIELLRQPEWSVTWSKHPETVDHPNFAVFLQIKLKSDMVYKKKSHEMFMKAYDFLKKRIKQLKQQNLKKDQDIRELFYAMRIEFNEHVARDVSVLYYCRSMPIATNHIHTYLLAKYGFKNQPAQPINVNTTWKLFEDKEVSNHPFYTEYLIAKHDTSSRYSFNLPYKSAAFKWIDFRRTFKENNTALPPIIQDMYEMLEMEMTARRSYDLFILSQFRMDMAKVKRMEMYLSEKYRDYLPDVNQDGLPAYYAKKPQYSQKCALLYEIINISNILNPVYTKKMVDEIGKILTDRKQSSDKHSRRVCQFIFDEPTEERVRAVYALKHVGGWEEVLYEFYGEEIDIFRSSRKFHGYQIVTNL
ncbi:unnamed protein product [Caenorhabditis sp. 36 PRJEB53466]|nr:unnamed protein product [Caenorhabditis sp. 36 PRJEB53466]